MEGKPLPAAPPPLGVFFLGCRCFAVRGEGRDSRAVSSRLATASPHHRHPAMNRTYRAWGDGMAGEWGWGAVCRLDFAAS